MEIYQLVISAIGSLGFPIVAWLLMYKMVNDSMEKMNSTIAELTVAIKEMQILIKKGEIEE